MFIKALFSLFSSVFGSVILEQGFPNMLSAEHKLFTWKIWLHIRALECDEFDRTCDLISQWCDQPFEISLLIFFIYKKATSDKSSDFLDKL